MTTRTFPVWLLVDPTDDEVLAVHRVEPSPSYYRGETCHLAMKRVPFDATRGIDPKYWDQKIVRCELRQAEVHEA